MVRTFYIRIGEVIDEFKARGSAHLKSQHWSYLNFLLFTLIEPNIYNEKKMIKVTKDLSKRQSIGEIGECMTTKEICEDFVTNCSLIEEIYNMQKVDD